MRKLVVFALTVTCTVVWTLSLLVMIQSVQHDWVYFSVLAVVVFPVAATYYNLFDRIIR